MKYRKKPVVVEAEVYEPGMEDGFRCNDVRGIYCTGEKCIIPSKEDPTDTCIFRVPIIRTMEGDHDISPGDYIIIGVRGERYPCEPDIFHMTYEPVGEK